MRLRKRLLRRSPNSEALELICKHYDELRAELVQSVLTVRNSQTAEDILHDAIYHVACECRVSDDVSDDVSDTLGVILDRVRHKYHSLRRGLECEERGRKEVLTDRELSNYGEDNEA